QPMMYKKIDQHPTLARIYADQLIKENIITEDEFKKRVDAYREQLEKGEPVVELVNASLSLHRAANWTPFLNRTWREHIDTTVPMEKLKTLGEKISYFPEKFTLQRNVQKIYEARQKMTSGELPLDWGYAENLAYASLATEGYQVRMS